MLKPLLQPTDLVVLSESEFLLLHEIILSYPQGVGGLSVLDVRLGALAGHRFVQQKGYRWLPTEAGVNHVMPNRRLAS